MLTTEFNEADEDAADRMTLLIAAEAQAEQLLPETVSRYVLDGDRLLRALRRWRVLTQAELAARSGVNQGFISEIESRANSASEETAVKLAAALDCPAGWLG